MDGVDVDEIDQNFSAALRDGHRPTLLRPRSSGTFGLQPETYSLNHTHLLSCVITHCDTPAATHSFTHINPHRFTHVDPQYFTHIDPHKSRGQGYV